jgi:hypothetical protein
MQFRPRFRMSQPDKDMALPMLPTTSKPKRQKPASRLLQRKFPLVIFIVLVVFLAVPIFRKIHSRLCAGVLLLSGSGFCPAILANVWHLFYHLGGNGPWIPRISGIGYSNTSLPMHCSVDQVHMVSRASRMISVWLTSWNSCRGMPNDILPRVQVLVSHWKLKLDHPR